jgi:hypothetical protein
MFSVHIVYDCSDLLILLKLLLAFASRVILGPEPHGTDDNISLLDDSRELQTFLILWHDVIALNNEQSPYMAKLN